MTKELIDRFSSIVDELHASGSISDGEESVFNEIEVLLRQNEVEDAE